MRNLALLLSASLALPLQAHSEEPPSSYVIDLMSESSVATKDIDEIENLQDFEYEVEAPGTFRRQAPETQPQLSESPNNDPSDQNTGEDPTTESEERLEDEIDGPIAPTPADTPPESLSSEVPSQEQESVPAPPGPYSVLTDPLETELFHVAGITWTGANPKQIDVRTLSSGEWTDWYNLEIDTPESGTAGTDPIMAAGSNGIQVRASGESLPDDFEIHLMTGEGSSGIERDSDTTAAETLPSSGSELEQAENAASFSSGRERNNLLANAPEHVNNAARTASYQTSSQLKSLPFSQDIVGRTSWGAPQNATWRPQYSSLEGAIVHHTAGTNNYTRSQAPGIVRGIWNYHTYTRGWGDIGYNFLIDKFGTVYEGRDGSVAAAPGQMAVGAHAAPANTGSVGVSVLGSYTGSVNPSNLVLDTISEVIAWQFSMADVDPSGTFTYGNNVSTNAISGHRDISATLCPGNIYPALGTIRTSVDSKLDQYNVDMDPVFVRMESSGKGWPQNNAWSMGDFSGEGTTDLMLRNSSGRIVLYEGRGDNSFKDGVQIGRGWNNFKELYTGVDFDGDNNPDVLTISNSNQLFLYPGNGNGSLKEGRQIGRGWGFDHLMVFEEGPNQNPAIAAISADGTLRMYTTNGRAGFVSSTVIGDNYGHLKGAVPVGDWDRSGYGDAVNVTASGRLRYFSDPTESNFTGDVQIGRGWGGLTILPGDSSNTYHDLLTVSPNGRLSTYIFSR